MDRCRTDEPPLDPVGGEPKHMSACWLPHNTADRDAIRRRVAQVELAKSAGPAGA
jgi:hypothetical protein